MELLNLKREDVTPPPPHPVSLPLLCGVGCHVSLSPVLGLQESFSVRETCLPPAAWRPVCPIFYILDVADSISSFLKKKIAFLSCV